MDFPNVSCSLRQTATVAGWGTTASCGASSSALLSADLTVVSDAACSAASGTYDTFNTFNQCVTLTGSYAGAIGN